ncbi:SDR family oxidoreductase [Turicibacter sanguinis]|uniref:SDR family oxidoreductase n=5 Tax=Turicibacteraceae TaxID=2810281 RepID=A0A6A8SHC7_9FIRM|nr:oxidoreductase, short chain dehydrogenase/reductase family protein [Turicibacter sanguinis PC909]EGC91101.1 oxidoreductase, short chain dehydrogenase/reductase family protein [Turicibacter sp. HGF1]KAB6704383.1 SDR family oxidoreductase [Phocaeicola vulgatus]MBP3905092.1 SDR family oxidoreductase [Turicibacter sp.]MTH07860.1 SDR family oxidoreductase [Turicibacter sanguinis]
MMNVKRYFITGASSGIGEDVTKKLIESNYEVIGCGLEEETDFKHPNFYYFQADVTDWQSLTLKLKEVMTENQFEKIDGIVTSAGVCGVAEDIYGTTEERFAELFNVNVMGTYNSIRAALPYLQNGAIVTLSSSLGTKPVKNCIGYSPAKAAICQLTQNLALELAPNIRVNTVAPSYIDTPMTRREPEKDAMRQALVANYPLQRIGYIEDVTPAILYLLSDQASFITGEILRVSGGGHLR